MVTGFLTEASHPALKGILLCALVLTYALNKGSAICNKIIFIARDSSSRSLVLTPKNKCRIKT